VHAAHSILCLLHWLDFEFDGLEALFMELDVKFTSKCIRRLMNFDVRILSTCFMLVASNLFNSCLFHWVDFEILV
jgi:hypothetical protein